MITANLIAPVSPASITFFKMVDNVLDERRHRIVQFWVVRITITYVRSEPGGLTCVQFDCWEFVFHVFLWPTTALLAIL